MVFSDRGARVRVALPEPANDARLEKLNALVRDAESYPDFIRTVAAL